MSEREAFAQPVSNDRPNMYYADSQSATGELYITRLGVTHASAQIDTHFQGGPADISELTDLDDPQPLWLEEESITVAAQLLGGHNILIEGNLGSGKSTVQYGARALLRAANVPYVALDGHFTNHADAAAKAIRYATRHGQPVLYDSFDYLWVEGQRHRNVGAAALARARADITLALEEHVQQGGRVVLSVHTEPWLQGCMSAGRIEEMRGFAASLGAETYHVRGVISGPEQLATIYAERFGADLLDEYWLQASESTEPTACTYRVTNVLLSKYSLAELTQLSRTQFDELVRSVDSDTRQRMGADPSYNLSPHTQLHGE